jgi:hypothetical protein
MEAASTQGHLLGSCNSCVITCRDQQLLDALQQLTHLQAWQSASGTGADGSPAEGAVDGEQGRLDSSAPIDGLRISNASSSRLLTFSLLQLSCCASAVIVHSVSER